LSPTLPERFKHKASAVGNNSIHLIPIYSKHWMAIEDIWCPVILSCCHLYMATSHTIQTSLLICTLARSNTTSIVFLHFCVVASPLDLQCLRWGSTFFSNAALPHLQTLVMCQVFLLDVKHICSCLTHLDITQSGSFSPDTDNLQDLLEATPQLISLCFDRIIMSWLIGPSQDTAVM
jgi:hypothetical protein